MKLSIYEGGYRVPGIIRYPPLTKAGAVSREPISGVDLLPTLCELGGAAVPTDRPIDGASVIPALTGQPAQRRVPLHWHYYNAMGRPKASLRDGDWKVVGIPAKDPLEGTTGGSFRPEFSAIVKSLELHEFELYNLARDVRENNNLARREPARLKQMSEQLITIHNEVKSEAPDWRTQPRRASATHPNPSNLRALGG
jgi:arylsulfatase A